ncbi:hypothetical protein [Chryseobacterium gallinarum]|uniref:hypothetical protein n=1 Tax=Chryseobacterium gallinarum TaxID=1324352 RepID=UPI0006A6D3B8|nr:hypothetical protein [Chryseobacterium gallinarum]
MKIKLLTFLSLSLLLASCSQDDTRDNVVPIQKPIERPTTIDGNNASRLGLVSYKLLKESGPIHPQGLNADESLTLEHNGSTYRLIMQTDNNLVLYRETPGNRIVLWHSNTHRTDIIGGSRLVAQTDGNLVIYTYDNTPLWSSNTATNYYVDGPHFKLQLYSKTGAAIPTGYRIKLILGGNNQERHEIVVEDFL